MKLEVNFNKKLMLVLGGVIVLAWVFVFVRGALDPAVNHGTNQINWGQPIDEKITIDGGTKANLLLLKSTSPNVQLQSTGVGANTFAIKNDAGSFVISESSENVHRIEIDTNGVVSIPSTGRLSVPAGRSFCNNFDTRVTDDSWKGNIKIDITINGRNICEDLEGCTYRIIKYRLKPDSAATRLDSAGQSSLSDSPSIFRQTFYENNHYFFDTGGGNIKGINGDIETTDLAFLGLSVLRDDVAGVLGYSEISSDALTFYDNNGDYSFIISVCDF